jgi:hypothetical protein
VSDVDEIREVFDKLSDDTKLLVAEIIRLEREKLYMNKPTGLAEAIVSAIKDIVK